MSIIGQQIKTQLPQYIIAFFLSFLFQTAAAQFAVTSGAVRTRDPGGRFGASLMTYLVSKSVAYHNNLTCLLYPFPYAKDLKLYQVEKKYSAHWNRNKKEIAANLARHKKIYGRIIYLGEIKDLAADKERHSSSLYLADTGCGHGGPLTPEFIKLVRHLVSPIAPIRPIPAPPNTISVAVHIRTGGTYDDPKMCAQTPQRCQPITFFASHIKSIAQHHRDKEIYVRVFTDDTKPNAMLAKLHKLIGENNVIYDTRKQGNNHDKNVLIDFFTMASYNYLIKPYSAFSATAGIIGDHRMIMEPGRILTSNGYRVKTFEDAINKLNKLPERNELLRHWPLV